VLTCRAQTSSTSTGRSAFYWIR